MQYVLIFFLFLLLSSSIFGETYSCKYNELLDSKTVVFDRVGHSYFKICDIKKNCKNEIYTVISADKNSLIFSNNMEEKKNPHIYKIIFINKINKLFTATAVNLSKKNPNHITISGSCVIN